MYEDIYGVELYGGTSDSQSGQGGGYYDDGYYDGYYDDSYHSNSLFSIAITLIILLVIISIFAGGVGLRAGIAAATGPCPCSSSAAGREAPRGPRRLVVRDRARLTAEAAASAVSAEAVSAEGGFRGGGFGGGGRAGGGGGRR